jgi:hypothetical protein
LTPAEQADARTAALCSNRIELLADRLACATDWLAYADSISDLPIGYYATGVVSAVAVMAAAMRPSFVSALVSVNGRPLLARPALLQMQAPTLLIVASADVPLIKVNRAALSQMRCDKQLKVIDALESAPCLARRWFEHYLVSAR